LEMKGFLYTHSALKKVIEGGPLLTPAHTLEYALIEVLESIRPKEEGRPERDELLKLRRFVRLLNAVKVIDCLDKIHSAYAFGRRFNVTLHKALYLVCASENGMALVTSDDEERDLADKLGLSVYALRSGPKVEREDSNFRAPNDKGERK